MIILTHPIWFHVFRKLEGTKNAKAPVHVRRVKIA